MGHMASARPIRNIDGVILTRLFLPILVDDEHRYQRRMAICLEYRSLFLSCRIFGGLRSLLKEPSIFAVSYEMITTGNISANGTTAPFLGRTTALRSLCYY